VLLQNVYYVRAAVVSGFVDTFLGRFSIPVMMPQKSPFRRVLVAYDIPAHLG